MPSNQKQNNIDSSYFLSEFYAKVKIKDRELLPQNIDVISIRESIFDLIPILELTFIDDGQFAESYPLEDGDIISIELAKSDQVDAPLSLEFVLQDFTIDNRDGDNIHLTNFSLTGIMKNNGLFFPVKTRSFSNKNSFDVLKSIASECGFDPNVRISTSDLMTWRQVNQSNYIMIYETMKRAFKVDDAILTGITRNKQFIITSLNTELKNKSVKKVLYDPYFTITSTEPDDKEKKEIIYFNNFQFKNISGMINKTIGYGIKYSYFDFENFINKQIISDSHSLTDYSFKNKNNVGQIVRNDSALILNSLNVHKNYFTAMIQNEFYINDFFKECLILYIGTTDKINLFDKIDVTFPSFDNGESTNQTLSGFWIVGTIVHQASKSGHYRMILTCFRNGINSSSYMKPSEFKVS